MIKMIKKTCLFMSTILLSTSLFAIPQLDTTMMSDPSKELTPEQETEMASFFLLYQLALKNEKLKKEGKALFGDDDLCIDYSQNENDDFKISLVVNAKSYETGVATYNYNDPKIKEKYDNLGKVFNIMDQFFKASKSSPKVTVNAFADPQNNSMQSYSSRSKNMIDSNNPYRDSQSKVNNILLAQDRGNNFVKQSFFPKDWGHREVEPWHSPNGEDQLKGKARDCPARRSVMVDLEFSPYMKLTHKPGEYSPKFDMVSGKDSNKMLVSAGVDALALLNKHGSAAEVKNSLPKACQTDSTTEYLSKIQKQVQELKDRFNTKVNHPKSVKEVMQKKFPNLKVNRKIFRDLYDTEVTIGRWKKSNSATKDENIQKLRVYSKYLKDLIDAEKYKETVITDPSLFYNAIAGAVDKGPQAGIKGQLMRTFNKMIPNKTTWKVGTLQQTTHAADCFSSKHFYSKSFSENMGKYTIPTSGFVNKKGGVKVKFGLDNMPMDSSRKAHGYFCSKCHSGIHFDNNGKKIITSRESMNSSGVQLSGLKGSEEKFKGRKFVYNEEKDVYHAEKSIGGGYLKDSNQTHMYLQDADKNNSNIFMMGANKSLRLMLIPGCKFSESGAGFDADYVQKVAKVYNINKVPFEDNIPTAGKDDCFFRPSVMTACKVSPTGQGNNEGSDKPKKQVSYFNLEKMKVEEFNIDENNNIMDALTDHIGRLTIQCGAQKGDNYDKVVSPQELVDSLTCDKRGIKVPVPSKDSTKECREPSSVQE